ncbi:MAG: 3-phosphoshikimate 1-carboxyvinyltransferase [Francisellaceae bacterium]|nr:3-phosphoshikimate 1-carboxyvinyltransferase [Francisellaceae bacterium]
MIQKIISSSSIKFGINATVSVPGDKSISHRALIISSISSGTVEITGINRGQDVESTRQALKLLGVKIRGNTVHGQGLHGLKQSPIPLYLGNSGTSMRLLCGLLAGQKFNTILTGDVSLSTRPMQRIIAPLKQMGARINSYSGCAPLEILQGPLSAINYDIPVASAQVQSSLQLASLYAIGESKFTLPAIVRNHSELMFKYFVDNWGAFSKTQNKGALSITIPGDISSAAFLIVAALIMPNSELMIEGVGLNPTRIGFLEVLMEMGANISYKVVTTNGYEPIGWVKVQHSQLHGININSRWVANIIDEMPILFIAAANAKGVTRVSGAGELRVKESDRLDVMAKGLDKIGVNVIQHKDGLEIKGQEFFSGAKISSCGDHRVAMAFLVAGALSRDEIIVDGCDSITTSYPEFFSTMESLGFCLKVKESINVE